MQKNSFTKPDTGLRNIPFMLTRVNAVFSPTHFSDTCLYNSENIDKREINEYHAIDGHIITKK